MNDMKFRFDMTFADGTQKRTYTGKIRKASRILRTSNWQTCHLEVVYMRDGQDIGINAGVYDNLPDALVAWNAFIEPDLVDWL